MFPDGRRVVSCDGNDILQTPKPGVVKVWDVATGKCVATLKGHSYGVQCVTVCSNGRRIVSTSHDCTLKVWGVAPSVDLSKLAELRTLEGHSKDVWCVAVFPDGQRVISASGDKTLKVWDVVTGECVATLRALVVRASCGVRCTFVVICLRRRSIALPCFRTGGASFLGEGE